DSLRQERLAELLDIGKAAISRTIDALEAKGYVARVRRKDDKRAYSVCLTDAGFSAGARVVRIYERLYALVRKSIADEELEGIESLLSRVAINLQSVEDASCYLNS
ncbi:MAG TPA: MarR family transcriptional regulator, partial [Clostridia bacterium]|nr:MarR family transcriptional regulator [Clostridia bacterium]